MEPKLYQEVKIKKSECGIYLPNNKLASQLNQKKGIKLNLTKQFSHRMDKSLQPVVDRPQ